MATHVIEIVSGIGEPAFVPLTMGKESPTLSIGRRGQWKVEGHGILDVHAYAYFDGQALFLQSADANNAACVDGFPVSSSWTEVRPPCSIELGGARLEYREEDAGDDATQAIANPALMQMRPPTPAPAAGRPAQSGQSNSPPARPTAPPPAPMVGAAAGSASRPFQPGAFSTRQEEDAGESTRVAPLDVSASRAGPRPAGGFAGVQQPAMMSGGFPNQSYPQNQPPMMGHGQMDPNAFGQQPPMMGGPNGFGMQQPPMQQPMMGDAGGGYPMHQQQAPGFAPYPGGSGAMPGGQMPGFNDPFGNQQQRPMGQPPPPQDEDALKKAIREFKAATPVRKLVLVILPIAMAAAAVVLLSDDPVPPPNPKGKSDSGAETAEAGAPEPTASAPVPAPIPIPTPPPTSSGVMIPSNPSPPTIPDRPPPQAGADAGAKGKDVTTLERKAVDEMYRGDLNKAATIYEQLAREQPQNPSYAYAAKILRERQANRGGQNPAPAPPSQPGPPR